MTEEKFCGETCRIETTQKTLKILKKCDGTGWTGLVWLKTGKVMGNCENGRNFQVLQNVGKFLD
jgi:hypothetical protein